MARSIPLLGVVLSLLLLGTLASANAVAEGDPPPRTRSPVEVCEGSYRCAFKASKAGPAFTEDATFQRRDDGHCAFGRYFLEPDGTGSTVRGEPIRWNAERSRITLTFPLAQATAVCSPTGAFDAGSDADADATRRP